jgi:glucose/arabinose dehydrogenase
LIVGFCKQPVFFICLLLSFSIPSIALFASSNFSAPFAAASSQNTAAFFDSEFAEGLTKPTSMAFAPDGRLFVNEQRGDLRVIKNGTLLEEPFLTVSVNSFTERGLNGIAFDPEFDDNGYVYVYYTTSSVPIHNRISRFMADTSNPDVAAAGSEVIILDLEELNESLHHNGGALNFGEDGKLYVGVGYNTNNTNPQSLATRLGKILRINSDGSIPSDNPFVNTSGAKGEIWAFGLRNPFTGAMKPGTNTFYVNDVGLATWEEINAVEKGGNYGWRVCEGPCSRPGLIDPIYAYEHPGEVRRVIAGGTFYEATQFPEEYRGGYFFGDFLGNYVKILNPDNAALDFLNNTTSPVDIDVGPDGSLYYLSYLEGAVHKVTYGSEPPMEASTVFATLDGNSYSVDAESTGARVTAATIDANNSVTVFLNGSGQVKLKLQKIMIDGITSVMAGSQELPFTTVESTASDTTIEFSVPTGVNSVEIMGATVVPEFGTVAVLVVLATSIMILVGIARFRGRLVGRV